MSLNLNMLKILHKLGLPTSSCRYGVRPFSISEALCGKTPGQLKDKQNAHAKKSLKISKLVSLAEGAINAGGGSTDPANNKKLALVLEQCSREGVPRSTVLNAAVPKNLDTEITYLITSHSGLATLIGCKARKPTHAQTRVSLCLKKSLFQATLTDPKTMDKYFERKGVVVIAQPFKDRKVLSEDESTELALEVNAEDVVKESDGLKFYCSPSAFKDVLEAFEDRDFPITYSSLDFIPTYTYQPDEDEFQCYTFFMKLLQKKEKSVDRFSDFFEIANNLK